MRLPIVLAPIAISLVLLAGCGSGKTVTVTTTGKGMVGLLFVQAAPHGTFVSARAGKNDFTLTLRDPNAQIVWFSDRPARHYGHYPVEKFVNAWTQFGFGSDPPNAALSLVHGDDKADTVIVKLGPPTLDAAARTVSFPAHRIMHASGRLADFENDNDRAVPERFADVSLFIDDASSGGPIMGCHGCQY